MFLKQYAPNRCEPSIEVSVRRGGGGGGGHGAYNQRIKVIAKMLKKLGGQGGGGGGAYEQRIEAIVKIAKKVHYENISMQYTAIFHGCKIDNFQMKIFDIFLILPKR